MRLVATAAAGAAVAQASEYTRRQPDPAQHEFGPAPDPQPVRAIGFRSEPSASITQDEDRDPPAPERAQPVIAAPRTVDRESETVVALPVPRPSPRPSPPTAPETQANRRDSVTDGAVSGAVTNVFGHGLRGLHVEVVAEDETVVGSATTGVGGQFEIGAVPPGLYKLRAFDDVEGEYEESWHGGPAVDSAEPFKVKKGKTRRKITVALRSTAQIDTDVTAGDEAIEVVITVTHRATGAPATGLVDVSTKDVDVTLTLDGGRAPVTLRGSAKKLRITYRGDHQTRPEATKVRVR